MGGIEVTASSAATAGGMASDLWFLGARMVRPPFWPRTLTVWVEVDVLVGVLGGMTTGLDWVKVGEVMVGESCLRACGLLCSNMAGICSDFGSGNMDRGLFDGGLADLAPIFS